MAKIYVASKFEDKARVRDTYAKLRAAGHEITCDWTNEEVKDLPDDELFHTIREAAKADARGVFNADAVILFPHGNGKGLFVELGIAVGRGIPIVVVSDTGDEPFSKTIHRTDGHNCIFIYLPHCTRVKTVEDAIKLVNTYERAIEYVQWLRTLASHDIVLQPKEFTR